MSWYGGYSRWQPYVPVAERRAQAAGYAEKLAKKEGRTLSPVRIEGRKIAKTFWGQAWCDNLESYSDFANRLPRGGTYVRNGSVIDLQIAPGVIKAQVSGSEIYTVKIVIEKLPKALWERIKKDCSKSITSLLDLLQGRLADGIMKRLTKRDGGLFPRPQEIKMSCSCPDWAGMCKHVAASMYGVGARLDTNPELLFQLRAVDHLELISQAVDADNLDETLVGSADGALAGSDLGELFGIDLDTGATATATKKRRTRKAAVGAKAQTKKARASSKPNSRSRVKRVAK